MPSLEEQLVAHMPDLRRLARALEGERSAADDLVQETVMRALQKLDLYEPHGAFVGWLATIMRNLFVDRARRRKAKPEEPVATLPPMLQPRSPGDPTERLVLRDLRLAIGDLPQAQREVLLLIAIRGHSYEDVATRLEVPLGTVRSRLFRARETLMRKLDPPAARASRPSRRASPVIPGVGRAAGRPHRRTLS
jgi:RNA polymerase sigma-70 factor (ECF subfamily)